MDDKNKMKYDKKQDYCTMSPDGLFGVRFNFSCYNHDRQYRNEVKSRKTRKQADKDFRDQIYKIYKKSKDPFKFDILGYLRKFKFVNDKWKKIVTFKSSNRLLILFRNHVLGYIVSRIYYFGVRLFAKRAWTV